MKLNTRIKAIQPLIIVLILAAFLRAWAVSLLPEDFDEPVYLQNAYDYASAIRSGELTAVIDYSGNSEHPPFVKLLYAVTILVLGKAATWTNVFLVCRSISAFFGIMGVLFIGLAIDPLAAGMLAVHTLAVKYTSQIYLEAVPHAMTIASVLALLRVNPDQKLPRNWFWLSAIALGIAAASKYSYLPVIIVVVGYIAIFEKKIRLHWLVLFGFISLTVFLLLDVYLWHDPVNRLMNSIFFHMDYSQGQHVQEVGYPWYQPFIWIFTSAPAGWHPNVFFYFGFDGIISIIAFSGLYREWKERRWLVIWLIAGIIFLLAWPTKWPQYALTVTPALVIMAAESLRRFIHWAQRQESYWGYIKEMLPKPSKWLWLAVGAFILFIAVIYLSAAIKLAVGRVGWSNISQENSFLPSNTIYALLPLNDGQMLIGTEHGAALWEGAQQTDESPTWVIYTTDNSSLPSDRILALATDMDRNLWFGTSAGIARFDGENWSVYHHNDLGLPSEYILCLGTSSNGHIFAGTLSGASVWNGESWKPIPSLDAQAVFSLTFNPSIHSIYFGIVKGVLELNSEEGIENTYLTDAPVKYLLVDSEGTLWAATTGAGLATLQGEVWRYYRVNNSGIPSSVVNWITEVRPGEFWIGTAKPTSSGGAPAEFSDSQWTQYLTTNSGVSGSEVTTIVVQADQIWIGTRSAGIDLFQLRR